MRPLGKVGKDEIQQGDTKQKASSHDCRVIPKEKHLIWTTWLQFALRAV